MREEPSLTFLLSFGENVKFLHQLADYRGWPLNPSVFSTKPIVCARGAFYVFHLQCLGRSAFRLFDELARKHDSNYRRHRYLKSRDNHLETESIKLISKALPECSAYRNLHYDWGAGIENGKARSTPSSFLTTTVSLLKRRRIAYQQQHGAERRVLSRMLICRLERVFGKQHASRSEEI